MGNVSMWRDTKLRYIKWQEYGPCPESGCQALPRQPCRNQRVSSCVVRYVTRPHAARMHIRKPGGRWPLNPSPAEKLTAAVVVRGTIGKVTLDRLVAQGWQPYATEPRPLGQQVFYLRPPAKVAS